MRNYHEQASAEGWGPAFPDEEYATRRGNVIAQMQREGIRTLFVTSPANITYLTGYDMVWYYLRTPTAVAIDAESGTSLFFDLEYHRPTVQYLAVVDDVACFESFHGAPEFVVAELTKRNWTDGTIGVERWARNPNAQVLQEIEAGVQRHNANVVDASWLVDNLRLVKSPLEREVMRQAAGIADQAMNSVFEVIRPGMSEIQIAGRALHAMMELGGGDPAIRVAVRSGPRFLARHCPPSHRKVQDGELVWVNFSGSLHRYHADLGRLVALGSADERWIELLDKASDIATTVLGAIRPGQAVQVLQDATERATEAAGIRDRAVLLGGYDMGIAIPPDWVGHTFTNSERGFVKTAYDIGVTTNFEMLFKASSDWSGGAGGGFIETVLMGEDGLLVLSKLARQIVVV